MRWRALRCGWAHPVLLGDGDDLVDVEVRRDRARLGVLLQQERLLRTPAVLRVAVLVAVDGDRLHVELSAGAHDANGDLGAVGSHHLLERGRRPTAGAAVVSKLRRHHGTLRLVLGHRLHANGRGNARRLRLHGRRTDHWRRRVPRHMRGAQRKRGSHRNPHCLAGPTGSASFFCGSPRGSASWHISRGGRKPTRVPHPGPMTLHPPPPRGSME